MQIGGTPLGTISLANVSEVRTTSRDSFDLVTPERTYRLQTLEKGLKYVK